MTLTIEIDLPKQKTLENIALQKGKNINEILREIVDEYLVREKKEKAEITNLMRLSETSFDEWDNEEDAGYDKL